MKVRMRLPMPLDTYITDSAINQLVGKETTLRVNLSPDPEEWSAMVVPITAAGRGSDGHPWIELDAPDDVAELVR